MLSNQTTIRTVSSDHECRNSVQYLQRVLWPSCKGAFTIARWNSAAEILSFQLEPVREGGKRSPRRPTESRLVWKWLPCERCFIHRYTTDNRLFFFNAKFPWNPANVTQGDCVQRSERESRGNTCIESKPWQDFDFLSHNTFQIHLSTNRSSLHNTAEIFKNIWLLVKTRSI